MLAAASLHAPLGRAATLALVGSVLLSGCGPRAGTRPVDPAAADAPPQVRQCLARGWQRETVQAAGMPRELLWKGPPGPWTKGAILVLHGGGGHHFQWCVANAPIVASQVRFTEQALADGFAVFLLESTDRVTDLEGRACGKVWDDELRERPNLDLPFLRAVLDELAPARRPPGSRTSMFITGLSSGGYMSVRAATHLGDRISAFAPVSSGDPYGWHRVCEAGMNLRTRVHGGGFDNETGLQITERDACRANGYAHERPWDGDGTARPPFRVFRHEQDGINDRSCAEKASRLLREHGHPGEPDFVLTGGPRGLAAHLWQDAYTRPLLDFFTGQGGARQSDAPGLVASNRHWYNRPTASAPVQGVPSVLPRP